jgi:FAD linked oxidases, C-terminal domain
VATRNFLFIFFFLFSGIGKIRSKWYRETVSDVGVDLLIATKTQLDPNNIFAVGNLLHNENADHHLPKSKL